MIPFPREFIVIFIVLLVVILLSGCANTIGHFGKGIEPGRSLADVRSEVVNHRTFGRF